LQWPRDRVQDSSQSLQERGQLKVWKGKPFVTDEGIRNKPHVYKILEPSLERAFDAEAA
jgi:hypothetical protein